MVPVVYAKRNSATCVARNGRTANVHYSTLRSSTTNEYHDIAVVPSSELNERSSGTTNSYGRLGGGEIHVRAKNRFEKCATRWRTDAIMAIGVEMKCQDKYQDTASFASTLATSTSSNASFARSPLATIAIRMRLLSIDEWKKMSSRHDGYLRQADGQC